MNAQGNARTISVVLQVPDTAWKVTITEVRRVGDELWVVAQLTRAQGMLGAQMITEAADTVTVTAPAGPVKYFVLGKTWRWNNDEPYTFAASAAEIPAAFAAAPKLYPAS